MGSKSRLLQVLTGKNGVNSVPTQGLNWRRERDSNPRYGFPYTHFPGVRLQPLGHPSGEAGMGPAFDRPEINERGAAVQSPEDACRI